MNKKVAFKLGTGFDVTLAYTPTEGLAPATLVDSTVTSAIRTSEGDLVATLGCTVNGEGDAVRVVFAGNTKTAWADWVGQCVEWDIKVTHADFPDFYTETVVLELQRSST